MGAMKIKSRPLRAVALIWFTLAAAVTACDSEAPTALEDALLDALANADAEANADGAGPSISNVVRDHLGDESRPLLFVDHVEVTDDFYAPLDSLDATDIARVDIVKGQAAADLFGDRAAEGVIQIFTKDYWETLDPDTTARPRD